MERVVSTKTRTYSSIRNAPMHVSTTPKFDQRCRPPQVVAHASNKPLEQFAVAVAAATLLATPLAVSPGVGG